MTNEPNTQPIEAPAPVEQAVEAVTPIETAPPVETSVIPDLDLSDLYQEPVQQQRPVQPDYEGLVEEIVSKVADRLKPREQEPLYEDSPQMDPNKITESVLKEVGKRQQAEKIIATNIQGAAMVANKYVEKLKGVGVDAQTNPALYNAADLLFRQMKIEMAAQLGRPLANPMTGQIDPVLTPQETATLINNHWKQFSQTYLQGGTPKINPVTTGNLSPAANAITNQGNPPKETPDQTQALREKRENGTLTREDVIQAMFAKTSQKK